MRTIQVKHKKESIPGYPYQLTVWMPYRHKLSCYIEDFVRYDDEKYGVIAESPRGYAIFTKGRRSQPLTSITKPGK